MKPRLTVAALLTTLSVALLGPAPSRGETAKPPCGEGAAGNADCAAPGAAAPGGPAVPSDAADSYSAYLAIQDRCFSLQKQHRLAEEAACYDDIVKLAIRTGVLDAADVQHYRTIAAQLRDPNLDKGASLRCTQLSWIFRAHCRIGQNDIPGYVRAACIRVAITAFSNEIGDAARVDNSPCRGDQRETIVREWLATYDDFGRQAAARDSGQAPPPALPQTCLRVSPTMTSTVPCKPGAKWAYTHVESVRGRDCPRRIAFRFEDPEDFQQEDWVTPFDIQTCGGPPRYIRTR